MPKGANIMVSSKICIMFRSKNMGCFKLFWKSVCINLLKLKMRRRWFSERAACKNGKCQDGSGLDHSDGQFFSTMEWLMFFFRPLSTTMVFQWFQNLWTITIECFWRIQPFNGFKKQKKVGKTRPLFLIPKTYQPRNFEFLRPMVNDGLHVPLHKKVRKINLRQNANSQHYHLQDPHPLKPYIQYNREKASQPLSLQKCQKMCRISHFALCFAQYIL